MTVRIDEAGQKAAALTVDDQRGTYVVSTQDSRRRWGGALGIERTNQLRPFGLFQSGTEVENRLQQLVGLEISITTAEMHIPPGGETPLVIEDDADTPAPPLDGLVAAAALGLSTGGPLGTVDTRDARVCNASEDGSPEAFLVGYALGCLIQRLQKRLRTLVRRA